MKRASERKYSEVLFFKNDTKDRSLNQLIRILFKINYRQTGQPVFILAGQLVN